MRLANLCSPSPDGPGLQRQSAAFALVTVLIHLAANPHYGFFRDELYYVACGRHPAWGYVDQPPMVPLLAAASQAAGVSLFALRAVPALLAGAATYVVCVLAAAFGGGGFAIALAALSSALAPVLMAFGTVLVPDSLQLLLWPLGILCVAGALDRDPAWWLAACLVFAAATEAKYSAVILAGALLAGIACTGRGRAVASLHLAGGAVIAGAALLPNLLWQWRHHLPMLQVLQAGQNGKNVLLSPLNFLWQQATITNPVLAPVWAAGLIWCLARPGRRWLGVGACTLLAIMIVLHGKAYYPAAIYPALFAAGGVAIERMTARRPRLRPVLLAAVLVCGAALAPTSMPILPEPAMIAYAGALARLGLAPMDNERHRSAQLGQFYADMHGWQHLADQVAGIARALPQADRAKLHVFAADYGQAAAIDLLAPHGLLPGTLSGHNQYWEWGLGDFDGTVAIDVGGKLEDDRKICTTAELVGVFTAPYVMPYENERQIILCRGLKLPLATLWTRIKHFD